VRALVTETPIQVPAVAATAVEPAADTVEADGIAVLVAEAAEAVAEEAPAPAARRRRAH
jgi:hypothetical protein